MEALVSIPYDKGSLRVSIPREKLLGCFAPREASPVRDGGEAVRSALMHPVDSPPLRELAAGRKSVAVVVDDHTRPVPTSLLVNEVMKELMEGGIRPDQVTVLVATGLHRPSTEIEQEAMLGTWSGKLRIENHDARNSAGLVNLGTTALKTDLAVNRTFMEAELKVLTGDVEYHQFCGYGGGGKSVYPGLASAEAIRLNHSRMEFEGTGAGRLEGNPVRNEIEEAARMASVDFLLCVVLDPKHRIVNVHAGNVHTAFRRACGDVDTIYKVTVPQRADMVIASPGGYPKDGTLYQAQKAIEVAVSAVRPGGKIVVAAACGEGSGSRRFEEWMETAFSPADVMERLLDSFEMGGHKAYQIARAVQQARIYLYSRLSPGQVRSWFMTPLRNWSDVEGLMSDSESVSVLPWASLTHVRVSGE